MLLTILFQRFFTVKSQWFRDKDARSKYKLDERLIVGSTFEKEEIDPSDSSLTRLRAQLPEGVQLGRHIIVMPAADRSLLDIFQAERPGLSATRTIMREVIEGIAHVRPDTPFFSEGHQTIYGSA